MLDEARIAVVVPAYDEERLLGRMLGKLPALVDAIYVVDDASSDATSTVARAVPDRRVRVLRHAQNLGVGAAIVTGYAAAFGQGADIAVVMAGDDQMDPADLEALLDPILKGRADYVKGNRFAHPKRNQMPRSRRLAGRALSWATRLATGLEVDDVQCGYTALSARAAKRLDLLELWAGYGYPNDLLGMLAARGLCVAEVPVRPVYADERSGVRPWHALVVMGVILRRHVRERGRAATSPILIRD